PDLEAELQLDRLKPRPSRRVLLLQGHQSSWQEELVVAPGTPPVCRNLTAYLRVRAQEQRGGEFKDKLSPVALSVSLSLPREPPGLVLYGDTLVQAQVGGTWLWGDVTVVTWGGLIPTRAHVGTPSLAELSSGVPSLCQCPQQPPGTLP
ncbi:ITA2B protein, partial [Chloropsis cyanopogon]|nr:ITA2B protein [Chloropsis cyanopogon]